MGRYRAVGKYAETQTDRLLSKVLINWDTGCWEWMGAGHDYGKIMLTDGSQRVVLAHRLSYELHVEPVPDGLQLDHLCRVRHCVNPAHLEPVTNRENGLRGIAARGLTHCPQGHLYDNENTVTTATGKRRCRACDRIRCREFYARNKRRRAERAAT